MKRIAAISLGIFYLFLSFGLQFNAHFCHGQLAKVALVQFSNNLGCGHAHHYSGPKNADEDSCSKKSCCEDVAFSIGLEDEHKPARVESSFDYQVAIGFQARGFGQCDFVQTTYADNRANGPPLDRSQLYLQNCSLVYYG